MISKTYFRYIWLLDTLLEFYPLEFEEIKRLWEELPMSKGESLSLRTFHEHRKGIREMFGVDIVCDKSNGYGYYVKNREVQEEKPLCRWLLKAYSVPHGFTLFNRMKDRVILEEIQKGTEYVSLIIDAMNANVEMIIDYQKYGKDQHRESLHVQPYALKVYSRRWYLLCYVRERDAIRNLALDRMYEVKATRTPFELPEGFDARAYYKSVIGVFVDESKPVKVRLRCYGVNVEYLRAQPLHKSQKEVQTKYGEYSEFTYNLCITPDLVIHLLGMGDKVEVLEPAELRDEMRQRIENMHSLYCQ